MVMKTVEVTNWRDLKCFHNSPKLIPLQDFIMDKFLFSKYWFVCEQDKILILNYHQTTGKVLKVFFACSLLKSNHV